MSQPYKHQRLNNNTTIRLIKLQEDRVDNQIACTIRHFEKYEIYYKSNPYDALSYVWGDATETREIRIRDETATEWSVLKLHENLWQFLDNAYGRKAFDRWIWTDRICLNQDDEDEKGEQIPRMAEIYCNAWQVVAWLGLTVEEGEALRSVKSRYYDDFKIIDANLRKMTETRKAALAVRHAPYWGRVWVVQEILSRRGYRVVCLIGNLEIWFDNLAGVVGFPEKHHASIWKRLCDNPRTTVPYGADPKPQLNYGKFDLWTLLRLVTGNLDNYGSKYIHDRVFGILGLAASVEGYSSPVHLIRKPLKAVYDESPAYVFIDALLESYPEWNPRRGDDRRPHYVTALRLLLEGWRRYKELGIVNIFEVFEEYMASSHTSMRHKQLAGLVLQTCDALFSIFSPDASVISMGIHSTFNLFSEYEGFHRILIGDIGQIKPSFDFKRTAQHNAAILGIALVLGVKDQQLAAQIFNHWQISRGSHPDKVHWMRREWQCCAHSPSQQLPAYARNPNLSKEDQVKLYAGNYEAVKKHYRRFEPGARQRKDASVSFSTTRLHFDLAGPCHGGDSSQTGKPCNDTIRRFENLQAGVRLELRRDRFHLTLSSWVEPN